MGRSTLPAPPPTARPGRAQVVPVLTVPWADAPPAQGCGPQPGPPLTPSFLNSSCFAFNQELHSFLIFPQMISVSVSLLL